MEFKDILAKRRSVRKFSPTAPSREVLLDIVRDALTAPSSRNMHTTRFLIVDDRETLDKIAEMRDYGSGFMTGAPAAIVVMGDTTKTDLWRENCAISATMLQLSIVEHGLASCWVHVGGRPRLQNEPDGATAEEHLRSFLDTIKNLFYSILLFAFWEDCNSSFFIAENQNLISRLQSKYFSCFFRNNKLSFFADFDYPGIFSVMYIHNYSPLFWMYDWHE